jgi:hypothetical protein
MDRTDGTSQQRQVTLDRSARNKDSSVWKGQTARSASTGQPEQGSLKGTDGTSQQSKPKSAWTGQPGHVSLNMST